MARPRASARRPLTATGPAAPGRPRDGGPVPGVSRQAPAPAGFEPVDPVDALVRERVAAREGGGRDWEPSPAPDGLASLCDVLLDVRPDLPASRARVLRGPVVRAVLAIPDVPDESAKCIVRVLYRLAAWDARRNGDVDLRRALDPASIREFLKCGLVTAHDGSRSTLRSYLRRVRLANYPEDVAPGDKLSRQPVQAPYTNREHRAWRRLGASLQGRLRDDFTVLLDLTFGAGHQAGEVLRAQGTSVAETPAGVVVRACNDDGVLRDVPVAGDVGERLLAAARLAGDGHLFRPGLSRNTSLENVVAQVAEVSPSHGRFVVSRARNTWLVDLLATGVPFGALMEAADLAAGTKTPTDLLPAMPVTDVHRAALAGAVRR